MNWRLRRGFEIIKDFWGYEKIFPKVLMILIRLKVGFEVMKIDL